MKQKLLRQKNSALSSGTRQSMSMDANIVEMALGDKRLQRRLFY